MKIKWLNLFAVCYEKDFITDFFKNYVKKMISLSMFSQSRFINERKEQEQEKNETDDVSLTASLRCNAIVKKI